MTAQLTEKRSSSLGANFETRSGRCIINDIQHITVTIALLATSLTIPVVDFFIIRAVWRAVRRERWRAVPSRTAIHRFRGDDLLWRGHLAVVDQQPARGGNLGPFEAIRRPAARRDAARTAASIPSASGCGLRP